MGPAVFLPYCFGSNMTSLQGLVPTFWIECQASRQFGYGFVAGAFAAATFAGPVRHLAAATSPCRA